MKQRVYIDNSLQNVIAKPYVLQYYRNVSTQSWTETFE